MIEKCVVWIQRNRSPWDPKENPTRPSLIALFLVYSYFLVLGSFIVSPSVFLSSKEAFFWWVYISLQEGKYSLLLRIYCIINLQRNAIHVHPEDSLFVFNGAYSQVSGCRMAA